MAPRHSYAYPVTYIGKVSRPGEPLQEVTFQGTILDLSNGGIGMENAARAVRAGASVLVAGNSVFAADDPPEALRELRRRVQTAKTTAR